MTIIRKKLVAVGAAIMVGLMSSSEAFAQTGGNNINNIAENIVKSIDDLPGLLSAISYLVGLIFGVLGVLKIKDHVENPSNVPLKNGAIALGVAGSLFALPMVYEAMQNTIGKGTAVSTPELNAIQFQTR